ncbi:alpha-1,2-fucosyltransferase [Niabella beijingensis]|uniref:alpha-1,2-fucosyltransferase n=1 Tax=Niabella beijingensis TaxID=2872700 RepID=UPI001CBDD9CC|nr:alpha-1,2-fucosyltransferase [Niabella beijingensis]MBZ4187676.1 alpha-1,2-fucosyltransferase [Niabella beijingensis]
MVTVNLLGGLGNQMFQYAFGRYLSELLNQDLFLNTNIYQQGKSNRKFDLDIFHLSECRIGDVEDSLYKDLALGSNRVNINERFFHFDDLLIKMVKEHAATRPANGDFNLVLSGYWQSFKYFQCIVDTLKSDFEFCNSPQIHWKALGEEILRTNSVMVNVRRGDYLQKLDYHGVVNKEYIEKSIAFMKSKVEHPVFYIFSDDMQWCRGNIEIAADFVFVDEAYYDDKYQFYLQLMAQCKYFVISNSSFAWWSAWLSTFKDKIVIAPKQWFTNKELNTKDLLPVDWLTF